MSRSTLIALICQAMDRVFGRTPNQAPAHLSLYRYGNHFVHEMDDDTLKATFVRLHA